MMWQLNSKQAKELTTKFLNDFLVREGFTLKNSKNSNIEYNRSVTNGFDAIYISFLDSFPGKKINYLLVKRYNSLELIVDQILSVVEPNRIIDKTSTSFATSFGYVNSLKTNSYMPEMITEEDVMNSCRLLSDFLSETGLPMIAKFSDIEELDKEINREKFWQDDWQMPFDLRDHFDIKRIVIAWLAGNPNFETVVDKTFEIMSRNSDGTYYDYDRNDLSLRIPYTVHYLSNLKR